MVGLIAPGKPVIDVLGVNADAHPGVLVVHVEFFTGECQDRLERLLGIGPRGRDLNLGSFGGSEHEDAQERLGIDGGARMAQFNLALKFGGTADELGRGAGVKSLVIEDCECSSDLGHKGGGCNRRGHFVPCGNGSTT